MEGIISEDVVKAFASREGVRCCRVGEAVAGNRPLDNAATSPGWNSVYQTEATGVVLPAEKFMPDELVRGKSLLGVE